MKFRIGLDARFFGPSQTGLGRYTQELVEHLQFLDIDYEFIGDYMYYDQVETVEHPDKFYRIDVEYEDPFSINEILEIHQYAKSIAKI